MTDRSGDNGELDPQRSFSFRDARRMLIACLLLLLVAASATGLDLIPSATYGVGSIAPPGGIRATSDAVVVNQARTDQARQAARDAVAEVYDYTTDKGQSVAAEQVAALLRELGPVDAAMQPSVTPEARKTALELAADGLPSDAGPLLISLPYDRWDDVRTAARDVLQAAEMREELREDYLRGRKASIAGEYILKLGRTDLSVSERQLVVALVSPLLVPNSFPSDTLTAEARDAAAARVSPVEDQIKAGQVIVDAGHQITQSDWETIHALKLDASQVDYRRVAAWMGLNALIIGLLLLWVWRFRPAYWHRNRTLLLIGLIFALAILAVRLPAERSALPYFVPVAAASILLAILLDTSIGLVVAAPIALIAGTANGSSLELSMYILLGTFAGLLAIRKGDRLHYFVQASIAMAIVNAIVISIFTLLGQHDVPGYLQLLGASIAAAVLASVISLGTFAVLGNLFGILTGWQLLELANPSQPLLRRLLMETPGTYHHALMVGNLAERAAAAIGADPLLTRVAAYYHDIGKLGNPIAFIENQAGGENIHDRLAPAESAAVLKQHVPDGIELAYRAKLPKPLIAFIPQHHGTALLSYFYAKEREALAEPHGGLATPAGLAAADAVDQRRFRHAGPKPQSKEAAILMLADGVEASVRSLSSRDEASIRGMVGRIIDERLKDGQLDECDLTIRDLERVREAFVQQLLGMYHQRIEYPQNKIVELESRRERGLA